MLKHAQKLAQYWGKKITNILKHWE